MNTENFSRYLKKLLVHNFPQSGHELFDYNHNTYTRSEDIRPFEKLSIVIDSNMENETSSYILTALCDILQKRPFSRSAKYYLSLLDDQSLKRQQPCSLSKLNDSFSHLLCSDSEDNEFDEAKAMLNRLYRNSDWTIFIMSLERFKAHDTVGPQFSQRSIIIYPDSENSAKPQRVNRTLCLGLDLPQQETHLISRAYTKKMESKMKPRHLNKEFIEALTVGQLSSLLEAVHQDDTLCMELRGDAVNIYYRGGSLFKISQKGNLYSITFDTNYDINNTLLSATPSVIEAVNNIPLYKQAMDNYFHIHPHYEREFQQTILRENNHSGKISRSTDYYIVDIEYAERDARFDMVAFKWLSTGASRKNSNALSLALIEVKYGDGALDGKAGIQKHLNDFKDFLKNEETLKEFKKDMEIVFHQKCLLGLMDGLQEQQFEVKLSKEAETIFIFANHDPDSRKLDKILSDINWAEYQFPVYAASSSYAGYGLFADCLQDLSKDKENN